MSAADEELLADMLKTIQSNMMSLRDAHEQRARLTAIGTAANKRVTVVLNADGVVIETRMADDIDELSPAELAKAVTTAAQQAFAEIKRKTEELVAPMQERNAGMPTLSELLPGIPDELTSLPTHIEASTAPLASAEREEPDAERNGTRRAGPGVTEPGW
ncbi:YbaB/EbfC family nucleoid-associated protein [Nocardia sp. KC 131]|uniref:YbaB/EbfC family nucleoid-associated protein n=1 Tax=Nocardia arseniciresistens TaxID=3392119 RepID=UPI00398EBD62